MQIIYIIKYSFVRKKRLKGRDRDLDRETYLNWSLRASDPRDLMLKFLYDIQ
jgi:hypothetical protein